MFAGYVEPVRKPSRPGLVKCQDCDGEYCAKTDWVLAYDITPKRSTANSEWRRASGVLPKDKCISCGSKDLVGFDCEEDEL